ncbi:MAG: hypothetical protein AAB634_01810, partial [Patescibacteria group bacterium]
MGGGCLRGDSLVLTNPQGPVRIDAIQPGAKVYTLEDGTLQRRKVLAAMKTGIKKVCELKTKNRTIHASFDHPFLKVCPENSLSFGRFSKFALKWTELQDLRKGDLVVTLRETPEEDGTPYTLPNGKITDENFCRLFGFLLGDGWISGSRESWKIFFSPGVNEIQNQYYIKLVQEVFGLAMKKSKNWYYANSKKIYTLLKDIGLKKPAPQKDIPNWIFSLPKEQKKQIIIGLAEADGHYSIQEGKTFLPKAEIKFEMSSETLIRGLKTLCDGIGLRTSNVTTRTREIKAPNSKEKALHTFWTVRIYRPHELLGYKPHPNTKSGINFLYNFRQGIDGSLEFFKHFAFNRVSAIKDIGEEEVYDITVDGSHNFVADGFVVHNTGTGASPVIADIAREKGILTVGIVTKPFSFEGTQRANAAQEGLLRLKDKVDALVVIPNDRIFSIIEKETSLVKAFGYVDDILKNAVQGIAELINAPGIINVDFADIRAIVKDAGTTLIGIGVGQGADRAAKAVAEAISSPLLETSIEGAKGVLFSIAGSKDLKMTEINEVAKVISGSVDPSAKIIFGAYHDKKLKEKKIKVTVIATGFNGSA